VHRCTNPVNRVSAGFTHATNKVVVVIVAVAIGKLYSDGKRSARTKWPWLV